MDDESPRHPVQCSRNRSAIRHLAIATLMVFAAPACLPFALRAQESNVVDPRSLLVDVSDADLDSLAAEPEFDQNHPVLQRVLRRLAQLDSALLVRSAVVAWSNDTARPGQLLSVRGQVSKLDSWQAATAEPSSTTEPLRCHLLEITLESGELAQVASLEIPRAWQGILPDENRRVACAAYFLRWNERDGARIPLLAARRISWYPEATNAAVASGWTLLGKAGIDVACLDFAATRAGQELDHSEMLGFLEWVAKADSILPAGHACPPLPIVDLLQSSRGREGSCFRVTGNVQRISEIDLSDNATARWLGLNRYFQIDLFVSLGDRTLNMVDPDGGPPLVIEHDYPVTLITDEVSDEIRQSQQNGTPVEATAFFYRLWSFPTILSRRNSPDRKQVSPLFIAAAIRPVESDTREFSRGVTWFVIIGVTLFALLVLWIWRIGRIDKRRPPKAEKISVPTSEK